IGKRFGHELAPRYKQQKKKQKGRVTVRTGGSDKGTTLQFGTYGARLKTEGLRITGGQLKAADAVLVRLVKKESGKYWKRLCTNIAVCVKGNATRMGKGKGGFDHWTARVPTGKVAFEVEGMHEQSAKEALKRTCAKLPGVWEFISKDAAPRLGLKAIKPSPEPVNYLEELQKNPTKKYANYLKSKTSEYKDFTGR
ncbi:hypothetical protein CANARDRAFT_182291, partial [[Candida] arabinofermentans NRRL YB-2248]